MRKIDLMALAFEIRSFAGLSTKLMAHDFEARLATHWPGMSSHQYGVLRILECHPLTIKELSDRMMLAPSTLVPIVDRLEHDALVVRGKDPDDRRRTPLLVTDQARRMLAQVPPVDEEDGICRALHAMGLERSLELGRLLQTLVEQMSNGKAPIQDVLNVASHAASGTSTTGTATYGLSESQTADTQTAGDVRA